MKMTSLWSHFLLVLGTTSLSQMDHCKTKRLFNFKPKEIKRTLLILSIGFIFFIMRRFHTMLSLLLRGFMKKQNISLRKSHLCAHVSHKTIHLQKKTFFN